LIFNEKAVKMALNCKAGFLSKVQAAIFVALHTFSEKLSAGNSIT